MRFWERMRQVLGLVLETHDALRKVIGVDDLVLIDLRRHAACHVAVDGNQIHLVHRALQDKRMFPILRVATPLTVEEQDAHVRGARPVAEIANSAVPLLKVLLGLASPLHTPVEGWSHNRVHAVQEDDGTWAQIAGKAGVDLKELLQLNDRDDGEPLPNDRPQAGTVILMPEPSQCSGDPRIGKI